LDCL